MRYDKKITFITDEIQSKYDPITSTYSEPKIIEVSKYANISDLGVERSTRIFGEYKLGRMVVRLQNQFKTPFKYIKYNNKKYKPINFKLGSSVFYIEEDSINAPS